MKLVTKYQTLDGKLHDTVLVAKRYADNRYGAKVTELAHQIAALEKYGKISAFLDNNLAEFRTLLALHDDLAAMEVEEID